MYEEKSRRYKRVKRADERIQGLGASCVFIHIFCLRHFYCSFSDLDRLFLSSAAEPKQRVKGLSMDALLCAAAAVFSSASIQSNDAMIKQKTF